MPKPAYVCLLFLCNLPFFGAQCVLGFLILLLEQCFYSNFRIMFLAQCLGAFNYNIETMLVSRCFWAFNYISNSYLLVFVPTLHDT